MNFKFDHHHFKGTHSTWIHCISVSASYAYRHQMYSGRIITNYTCIYYFDAFLPNWMQFMQRALSSVSEHPQTPIVIRLGTIQNITGHYTRRTFISGAANGLRLRGRGHPAGESVKCCSSPLTIWNTYRYTYLNNNNIGERKWSRKRYSNTHHPHGGLFFVFILFFLPEQFPFRTLERNQSRRSSSRLICDLPEQNKRFTAFGSWKVACRSALEFKRSI